MMLSSSNSDDEHYVEQETGRKWQSVVWSEKKKVLEKNKKKEAVDVLNLSTKEIQKLDLELGY